MTDGKIACLVGAIAGGFLVLTTLPAFSFYDSAEFAAVGWRLSLSHPPGHPLHALLAHGGQRLPLGDLALRANLLSAVCLAVTSGVLYRLLRSVAQDLPRWSVFCAALIPAIMPTVWLQGIRAEVYTLQLLLTMIMAGLTVAVARGEDDRALPALALVFGLAGANHSLVGLFWLPMALWAMAVGVRRLRPVLWAVPAGALGLATYLYLPLRATAGGIVGWGRPDTPAAVWGMISARDWARSVAESAPVDYADNVLVLVGYMIEQLGPIGGVVCFATLIGCMPWLVRRRAGLAAAAAVAIAVPFASRGIFLVDLTNPDLGGYVAGGMVAFVVLVALAIDTLPDRAARWVALVLPVTLITMAPGFDPGQRLGARSGEQIARARLAEVPPDGVLVTSDYNSAFQGWALRALYGARPDVALVFRGRVEADWHRTRLAVTDPRRAAALPTFPEGFDGPEVRYELGVELQRLGPLAARLRPAGLTAAADGPWPSVDRVRTAFAPWLGLRDVDGRRAAAFAHAEQAAQIIRLRGPAALASWHLDRAQTLAPHDVYLAELRQRSTHLQ